MTEITKPKLDQALNFLFNNLKKFDEKDRLKIISLNEQYFDHNMNLTKKQIKLVFTLKSKVPKCHHENTRTTDVPCCGKPHTAIECMDCGEVLGVG